ncbi:MAG: hypothetical protein WC683_09405 [bacterium]|jgi:hypothetical protein
MSNRSLPLPLRPDLRAFFEETAAHYPATTEEQWYYVVRPRKRQSRVEVAADLRDGVRDLAKNVGRCFTDGALVWWPKERGPKGEPEIWIRWRRR